MSRVGARVLIIGLLIIFGIFYGIDIATQGIERIHGSLDQESSEIIMDDPIQEADVEVTEEEPVMFTPVPSNKLIHQLSDQTGKIIQITFQSGVNVLVSIFEDIIH